MHKLYTKNKGELSIEFWIVTGCIVVAFIFSLIDQVLIPVNSTFTETGSINGLIKYSVSIVSERFIPILFNHLIIYICYLFLNFHVALELNKKEPASKSIFFIFFLIVVSILIGVINIYWAVLLAIKILFILFSSDQRSSENRIYFEAGFLLCTWILTLCCMYFMSVDSMIKIYTLLAVPMAFLIYMHAVNNLIPSIFQRKWKFSSYFVRMLSLGIFSSLLLFLIVLLSLPSSDFHGANFIISSPNTISIKELASKHEEEKMMMVSFGNFFTVLLVVVPVAWSTYKIRNEKKAEEIQTLKTELGKSDANLNFLKSQINPHFLFNALNTLYGTALQEHAERTGEGIQKLGDMMRFMLQENMEDKISLSRDVDYLRNYIDLQKLRTSISSQVAIEVQIDDDLSNLQITPMLLIPFVENAFKHGISLQYPSHIKITLQINNSTLYFDVHNSIHLKQDNDPEKLQSGIGLQNVKQRLALIYPGRHELIIRQNAKEFFIHLTLQLTENH